MGATMDYLQNNPAYQNFARSFPDANLIFTAAEEAALAGQPWDANKFTAAIQNTQWFKSTPAGQRQYLFTQVFDPASATRDANEMARKILDYSNTMGIPLSFQQGAMMADQAITGGWDDARIQQEVVAATKYGPNLRLGPGTIAASQTRIRGLAGDYGMSLAPQTAYDWATKIADGLSNEQSFTEYAKNQAKISHPYWDKQLDQGMTVRQLADPYIQQAAKLLEISPDQVDLSNSKWRFTQPAKDGQQQPMSQLDWERKLMTDPAYQWSKTANARDSAFGIVDQIRHSFGAA